MPRKKIVAVALALALGAGTAAAASQAGPRVKQKGQTATGQSVTVIGQPGQSVTTGGGTARAAPAARRARRAARPRQPAAPRAASAAAAAERGLPRAAGCSIRRRDIADGDPASLAPTSARGDARAASRDARAAPDAGIRPARCRRAAPPRPTGAPRRPTAKHTERRNPARAARTRPFAALQREARPIDETRIARRRGRKSLLRPRFAASRWTAGSRGGRKRAK